MKVAVSEAFRPSDPAPASAAPPDAAPEQAAPIEHSPAAQFWLEKLFWLAERSPLALRMLRPLATHVAFRTSAGMHSGTLANAARILGANSTQGERNRLARAVISNFILFCHDVGVSTRMTADELANQVERIEGHKHYKAARDLKRGAIVVTAHMGSFEVGMAALRQQDAKIHVVFQRDVFARFERMRSALRAKLGVIEAPVDDGWTIWMRLREALLNNEVVVLQGDRVMPGQKGERVQVLGADMMLPAGPVKLALATGAPIVPVFSVRSDNGKMRLCVEPAIEVRSAEDVGPAMNELAAVVSKYVRAYGDQWLVLQPAWCDDA